LTLALAKSSNTTLKEWIQAKSPAGLTLASAFVAQHLVDSVLAAVSDAMNSDSWVDVATLLPPNLPVTDSIELLQQLERQKELLDNSGRARSMRFWSVNATRAFCFGGSRCAQWQTHQGYCQCNGSSN